jgi:hypothetical protein
VYHRQLRIAVRLKNFSMACRRGDKPLAGPSPALLPVYPHRRYLPKGANGAGNDAKAIVWIN